MKTILLLSALLWAASAAPAELQAAAEAAVESPIEVVAAAPEEAAAESPVEDVAAVEEAAAESPVEDVAAVEEAAVESPIEVVAAAPEEAAAESPVGDVAAVEARFNFCPQGWFSLGSRCFKFISSPMTWFNAEEHCNQLGANLASVISLREYDLLQQMAQLAGQSNVWLGGFALQGRWMWIDRQGFQYTNWSSQYSSSANPCIYLRSTTGWSNASCNTGYRFICSKNPFSC